VLDKSEIGQYSYTKLLREMEATMFDLDGAVSVMVDGDNELAMLPEEWLEKSIEDKEMSSLSDNLYVMPELTEQLEGKLNKPGIQMEDNKGPEPKASKHKWGPVLVEKRFSKGQYDGRTVIEKPQERKKKANLDGMGGNSKS
jgi:hypothetical protein